MAYVPTTKRRVLIRTGMISTGMSLNFRQNGNVHLEGCTGHVNSLIGSFYWKEPFSRHEICRNPKGFKTNSLTKVELYPSLTNVTRSRNQMELG